MQYTLIDKHLWQTRTCQIHSTQELSRSSDLQNTGGFFKVV